MINLFKSQEQIITEIHNEFDTAQDRLQCQAEKMLAELNIPTETNLISRGERLKKAGFVNVPLSKYSEVKSKELVSTREQAELIRHYKQNYPMLKFLTEPELDRICKKYGLMYAPVDRYKKDVPEKNLQDIEKVQWLNNVDRAEDKLSCRLSFHSFFWGDMFAGRLDAIGAGVPRVIQGKNFGSQFSADSYIRRNYGMTQKWICDKIEDRHEDRQGLFIAAPKSHFNLKGLKKNGLGFFNVSIIEVKDPIVFRYCKGGVQVITKWGLEAEDPELLVDRMN